MPIIKKTKKKLKRDRNMEIAGRLSAVKHLINMQVTKTFHVLITVQFLEIKKRYENLTFDSINYLLRKLIDGITLKGNEKLFDALAAINYTNGPDEGIVISKEGLDNFAELAKDYVTIDKCIEILETYSKSGDHLETLLGATKILNERASGEEFEIISE